MKARRAGQVVDWPREISREARRRLDAQRRPAAMPVEDNLPQAPRVLELRRLPQFAQGIREQLDRLLGKTNPTSNVIAIGSRRSKP